MHDWAAFIIVTLDIPKLAVDLMREARLNFVNLLLLTGLYLHYLCLTNLLHVSSALFMCFNSELLLL